MRAYSFAFLLATLCGAFCLAPPTWADDWRQFRHDAQRSGASADPVKVPLAEIWSLNNVSSM